MFVSRKFLIALAALSASVADAATFTVTNVNPSGAGSLHQAILSANADDVADIIHFNIPGGGVKTIPGALPGVTQPVTIDGYTQPGSAPNTAGAGSTNAVLQIELDGSGLDTGDVILPVLEGPTTIRGLAFTGIPPKGFGLSVGVGTTAVSVKGCFLGTSATGLVAGSAGNGIVVDGTATIGTGALADRNLISGNPGSGVLLRGPNSVVQNNMIGLDADGVPALGNNVGVQITSASATGNRIGGTSKGTGNDIAGNDDEGILVTSTAGGGGRFEANRMHSNGELGIDYGGAGVTHNDAEESDGVQNFPEISFARINGSNLRVEGLLASSPGQYRIEIFESTQADASGFGEGEIFRDAFLVVIPPGESAVAFVNDTFLNFVPTEGFFVTATATGTVGLETSEFSRATEAEIGGLELVVTNTNDSGVGSLRAALATANLAPDPNTIVFDIPGEGPFTIVTQSDVSIDEAPAIIDGYTQPGSSINTATFGTNANIQIAIEGRSSTAAVLNVLRTRGIVRGLSVHSGPDVGVRFVEAESSRLEGCFVGTDPTGTIALGNGDEGVSTGGSTDTVIGGFSRAHRNLLSGNDNGIGDTATGSRILGNLIGTDASGLEHLPNVFFGILASGFEATIGGDLAGLGNFIRGNTEAGIQVLSDSVGVEILGNDIGGNGKLGIDLSEVGATFGVSLNDADDADDAGDGANALQNFPVIDGVEVLPGELAISGSLDVPGARLNTVYRLRFFRTFDCDANGHGEGDLFLGAVNVLIPNGEQFELELPGFVPQGEFVTATATDPETGNTSEFSACFEVGGDVEPPPLCGDASLNEEIAAGDALFVLQAAVGTRSCDLCVCDVNDNGAVQSGDALSVLRAAVGQTVTLECPACE